MIRIGIDLGGTKIEAVALDEDGRELARERVLTPAGDYQATLRAVTKMSRNCGAGTSSRTRWRQDFCGRFTGIQAAYAGQPCSGLLA